MILAWNLVLLISPPLALLFSGLVLFKAPSRFRVFLPAFISVFFIVAYCYNPPYENDLARYFAMIDMCRNLPFSQAMSWGRDGLVVKNLLFWGIAQIGDEHLLPAISTSILYGVSMYIACDTCRNYKSLWKVITIQLMFLPLLESICNVRNIMAFALIILAVYRDIVKKRRDVITLLLYVLPCFIHFSGFVLPMFRIAVVIIRKHPAIAATLCIGVPSIAIFAYNTFYSLLGKVTGNIGLILRRAILKAYASSVNTSDYAVAMRESGYINACRAVIGIALILLIYLSIDYVRKKEKGYEFAVFTILLASLTVVWIVLHTVKYWVFAVATFITIPHVLAYYIGNYKSLPFGKRMAVIGIAFMAILRMILELYFMSSRVYPYELATNSFIYNIYYVCLHGIFR